ncbi:DUF6520 family protein [Belliella sp. R4-6]|uniref:DUF6520 family protein n=1 Tax=Belliella alkalica TaxID=1730871 RepID=A0ABS9V617_9BACT|nr:DUF6520 family protein [Belliella alkalica]MCH7411857.1 DUF6520 family protein [Belliella alkalica]
MNNLVKRLPLFAFIVAAVFAFAFTQPTLESQNSKWANDPNELEPVNITGLQLGTHYLCDEEPEVVCTYEEFPNGMRVPDSEIEGIYTPL